MIWIWNLQSFARLRNCSLILAYSWNPILHLDLRRKSVEKISSQQSLTSYILNKWSYLEKWQIIGLLLNKSPRAEKLQNISLPLQMLNILSLPGNGVRIIIMYKLWSQIESTVWKIQYNLRNKWALLSEQTVTSCCWFWWCWLCHCTLRLSLLNFFTPTVKAMDSIFTEIPCDVRKQLTYATPSLT